MHSTRSSLGYYLILSIFSVRYIRHHHSDCDFVSVLLGLSFGVYTVKVTISCIYYFVFTISFYFMHSINLSGYLAASVQIKPVEPVDQLCCSMV